MGSCGKRLLAILLIGFTTVLTANAAYGDDLTVLWWQVGDWQDDTETGESLRYVMVQRADGEWTTAYDLGVGYARIREVSTDTYLNILDMDEHGNPLDFTLGAIDVPMRWVADISKFASGSPEYSFVIELGNYESDTWSTLAVSEAASYADLAGNSHIEVARDYNPVYVSPWTPTSYEVAPEPASGMLVALGAALLALRRGKRVPRRG